MKRELPVIEHHGTHAPCPASDVETALERRAPAGRRGFLRPALGGVAVASLPACRVEELLSRNYRELSKDELTLDAIRRLIELETLRGSVGARSRTSHPPA